MTTTAVAPWGLSRMTEPLPELPPLHDTTMFDPDTQITHFYAGGALVDMAKTKTDTYSKAGGDDNKNSSKVDDDHADG